MTLLEQSLDKLPPLRFFIAFTGTREEMQACVAHGIYIGIYRIRIADERHGLELRNFTR